VSAWLLLASALPAMLVSSLWLLESKPELEMKGKTLKAFVYADPEAEEFLEVLPAQLWRRVLVSRGRVPFLTELAELRLASGVGELPAVVHAADTSVFFGLQGNCSLQVWEASAARQELPLRQGAAVVVFPGTKHALLQTQGSESCLILSVLQESGGFDRHDAASGFVAADAESLPVLKTAHESDLLSKKVYLAAGRVPGLFQVSLARLAPGAQCEEHAHRSAAEVYVNYDGKGCHLKMQNEQGQSRVYDLTRGKVAVINPQTLHSAWNDDGEPCQNINLMIGSPKE
ncbi:unnamed protein product, partial [Polarella glacialis]